MLLNYFIRRTKLRTVCIAVSFVSLVYIFYQFKASEDIAQAQLLNIGITKTSFSPNFSLKGVHPDTMHRYKPNSNGMFSCFKSGQEISYSKVNDDYCDCIEDGSDEPGTSACGFNTFHCSKSRKGDQSILTSRVNDGICDCCDGSDEYLKFKLPMSLSGDVQRRLGRYLSPCVDRC